MYRRNRGAHQTNAIFFLRNSLFGLLRFFVFAVIPQHAGKDATLTVLTSRGGELRYGSFRLTSGRIPLQHSHLDLVFPHAQLERVYF